MNQTTKKTQKKAPRVAAPRAASESVATISLSDLGVLETQKKAEMSVTFSTWVRSLLQNWRQGTVACKGRADVTSRSNKKPWKQKGTGRARSGSPRSPLWRGGGVTFGPQARVRTLTLSQQAKKGVLNNILFDFVENGKVVCLDWALEGGHPKTAPAYAALKKAGLHDRKVALFLPNDDILNYASFINIPNVAILFFDQANAFDLVNNTHWIVLKKDLDQFKEMALRWI